MVLSSSCSSPGDKSYDGEEYSYTLEIGDESALDGEVGKWLNEMVSVPVSGAYTHHHIFYSASMYHLYKAIV